MKLMNCPVNGPRPVSEFFYGGEMRDMPDPESCSDDEWAAYVFYKNGAPSIKKEWWCHVPSNTWFIAVRDTAHDDVLRTSFYGAASL